MVAKTSEYKREVEILAAEVKFLRCQVGGGGDTSAHRANTAVVDGILNALKADMVSQDANITGSIDILRQVSTP
ncbi:hypothetical protein EB796_003698 [Bugula neritina]|uniref:Uncharacterized protein n=1 Tax=Bugula neritina TaxID=10212 RepID=A0A7J7IUC5_BUGNE|nr:hypothetical protein EB796_024702 [Bugula neritina]KAF6037994.1 hypothetical protein EB796_003698 [Bugula neritina]